MSLESEDVETFGAYLKYLWREERWFYYLAVAFASLVGVFTFCFLLAVQH
jgi:hypothetical protein